MTGYCFAVSCLRCGQELRHENGVTRAGTESVAVCACTACGARYSVTVHLRAESRAMDHAERKREQRVKVSA